MLFYVHLRLTWPRFTLPRPLLTFTPLTCVGF